MGVWKFFVSDDYVEQIIRFEYKDNLIVSLDSFMTGKPSNLYIQAIKKTTVKVISKQQIDSFLQVEANRVLWVKLLEDLLVQQMEKQIDILTNSQKER